MDDPVVDPVDGKDDPGVCRPLLLPDKVHRAEDLPGIGPGNPAQLEVLVDPSADRGLLRDGEVPARVGRLPDRDHRVPLLDEQCRRPGVLRGRRDRPVVQGYGHVEIVRGEDEGLPRFRQELPVDLEGEDCVVRKAGKRDGDRLAAGNDIRALGDGGCRCRGRTEQEDQDNPRKESRGAFH